MYLIIGTLTQFLFFSIGIDVVWFGPLMATVFSSYLSIHVEIMFVTTIDVK